MDEKIAVLGFLLLLILTFLGLGNRTLGYQAILLWRGPYLLVFRAPRLVIVSFLVLPYISPTVPCQRTGIPHLSRLPNGYRGTYI